jgi:hypothetical protein
MDAKPMDEIRDTAALRRLYGDAMGIAIDKEMTGLDRHCRDFLALSPFMVLGTAAAGGAADVSPKGDMPGFVQVLDDHHILIPDRPGNNRLDSMTNILDNPEVATIFLVPGVKETLRINGRARIVSGDEVVARFEIKGKLPKTALLIEIREVFMHCAKALQRSRLWEDDYKVDRSALPRYAEILADHGGRSRSADEIQQRIDSSARERMW